jgi:hypothetical protein
MVYTFSLNSLTLWSILQINIEESTLIRMMPAYVAIILYRKNYAYFSETYLIKPRKVIFKM